MDEKKFAMEHDLEGGSIVIHSSEDGLRGHGTKLN